MAVGSQAMEDASAGREAPISVLTLRPCYRRKEANMTHTAGELAQYLGVMLEGDAGAKVSSVASPERARDEDLIYIESPRHRDRAAASLARCVLAPPTTHLAGKTILEASEPKLAFAKAAEWLLRPLAA